MRRDKRDRGKPFAIGDLQIVARFRAELVVYEKCRSQGMNHNQAMAVVFADELAK